MMINFAYEAAAVPAEEEAIAVQQVAVTLALWYFSAAWFDLRRLGLSCGTCCTEGVWGAIGLPCCGRPPWFCLLWF